MKKAILIGIITCFCVVSLVSCSGGIKGDEAKAFINDFFAAIADEDYDKAEEFLHPERPADLEAFLLSIEENEDIDFQSGIEIEKYTRFSSTVYNSTVGGATYELTMSANVGGKEVEFTIEIVKNEKGYGIYNFDLDA